MNDLFGTGLMADMFAPAVTPTEVVRNGRTYCLMPKTVYGEPRLAINWKEPGRSGVIGGFYPNERAALEQIELIEHARTARASLLGGS